MQDIHCPITADFYQIVEIQILTVDHISMIHPSILLLLSVCMCQDADPVALQIRQSTEEGKKVSRNHGTTWEAVFRRIEDTYNANETTGC